jgi:hypothetical protein
MAVVPGPHPAYAHEVGIRLTPLFFELMGTGAIGSASSSNWPDMGSDSSAGFTTYLAIDGGLRTIIADRLQASVHYGYRRMGFKYGDTTYSDTYLQGDLQLRVPLWMSEVDQPTWIPEPQGPGERLKHTETSVPSHKHVSVVSGFRVIHTLHDKMFAVPLGLKWGKRTAVAFRTPSGGHNIEDEFGLEARGLLYFPDVKPGVDVTLGGYGKSLQWLGFHVALFFEYLPALQATTLIPSTGTGAALPPHDGLPAHATFLLGMRLGATAGIGL